MPERIELSSLEIAFLNVLAEAKFRSKSSLDEQLCDIRQQILDLLPMPPEIIDEIRAALPEVAEKHHKLLDRVGKSEIAVPLLEEGLEAVGGLNRLQLLCSLLRISMGGSGPTIQDLTSDPVSETDLLDYLVVTAIDLGASFVAMQYIYAFQKDANRGRTAARNLKPHRDRLQAEADEFWEDWRRQYRQRIDLFGDTKSEAFKWVVGEMAEQGARLPSTREFPSETILYKQLRKKPAVDWMPNRLL